MAAKRKSPAKKSAGKKPARPKKPAALEPPLEGGPGPGQPTLYRPKFCQSAASQYGNGATDAEVAASLGIDVRTLYRWKNAHPEFCQAGKLGREAATDRVEAALYNRAVGYDFAAVKIMQAGGAPLIVPYIEHVPPDPAACLTWLKNCRPGQWRDTKHVEGKVQLAELLRQSLEGAA